MTKQEIDFRRAVEEERHNRAQEQIGRSGLDLEAEAQGLTKRGQDVKAVTDVLRVAGGVTGAVIGKNAKSAAAGAKAGETAGEIIRKVRQRNDASWWNNVASAMREVANAATKYPLDRIQDVYGGLSPLQVTSGCIVPFIPQIGGKDEQAYFNYQLDQMFQRARIDNTADPQYTKADQGKLILCFDSIYTLLEHAKLCILLSRVYNEDNSLQSRALLAGLTRANASVDINDFMDGSKTAAPGWEEDINQLEHSLNNWAIPNSFPFMINHIWMVSRLFTDYANDRSEWMMYKPMGFYEYAPDGLLHLRKLPFAHPGNGGFAAYVNRVLATVTSLYNDISGSSFAKLVAGDFRKPQMFGMEDSHYVRIPAFSLDNQVALDYDHEAIERIRNLKPVPLVDYFPFEEAKEVSDAYDALYYGQTIVHEDPNGNLVCGLGYIDPANVGYTSQDSMAIDSYAGDFAEADTTYAMAVSPNGGYGGETETPSGSSPTYLNPLAANFLLTGNAQLTRDEILVYTRGMPQFGSCSFEQKRVYTDTTGETPTTQTRYRAYSCVSIKDFGTELYSFPIYVVHTHTRDTVDVYEDSNFYRAVSALTGTISFGTLQTKLCAFLSMQSYFAPKHKAAVGYSITSGGWTYVGYLLAYGSGTPSIATQAFISTLGETENFTVLPAVNLKWAHKTAVASAFKSTFWH